MSTRASAISNDVEALLASGRDFSVEARTACRRRRLDAAPAKCGCIGLGDAPMLSELMPTLQNFGIRVLSEDAHELAPCIDGKVTRAYAAGLFGPGPDGAAVRDKLPGASMLADAIAAVRNGLAADDPLNTLTLTAGLTWREVALLRAYLVAAFQMRLAPARPACSAFCCCIPTWRESLFDLFVARLSIRQSGRAGKDRRSCARRISLVSARSTISSTIAPRARCSRWSRRRCAPTTFCRCRRPIPYIALKFESAKIPGLPDTAPLYEIHVNSPRDGRMPSARTARSRAAESASAIVPTITAPKFST